jgi:hypothetical protein
MMRMQSGTDNSKTSTALKGASLMTHSTAVSRLALWKAALIAVLAVAATLALAGRASAQVFFATPGSPSDIAADITTANGNADPINTIVMQPGIYSPTAPLPPITLGPSNAPKTLVFTSHHSDKAGQAGGSTTGTAIDGTAITPTDSNTITINPGVNVIMEGFSIRATSGPSNQVIVNDGHLQMYNMFVTSSGNPLILPGADPTESALIVESSFVQNAAPLGVISNQGGTVDLINDDINNNTGGIGVSTSAGTTEMHNTIDSLNGASSCDVPVSPASGNITDGTCGGEFSTANPNLLNPFFNGGPTPTSNERATAPGIGHGDPAFCGVVDERFWVHTTTGCDIGSFQSGASHETTPPSCVVTGGSAGPPATQQVTVTDTGSGLGPQAGSFNDPLTTSTNPSAVVSPTIDSDPISGLGIDNGSVAFSTGPNTGPSTTPVVLTATKATQGVLTHWWFTATDWAGNTKFCR